MPGPDHDLIRAIENEIASQAGRYYRIKFELLDNESLRALRDLLRDLDSGKRNAIRRAQTMPWRSPSSF